VLSDIKLMIIGDSERNSPRVIFLISHSSVLFSTSRHDKWRIEVSVAFLQWRHGPYESKSPSKMLDSPLSSLGLQTSGKWISPELIYGSRNRDGVGDGVGVEGVRKSLPFPCQPPPPSHPSSQSMAAAPDCYYTTFKCYFGSISTGLWN